VYASSCTLSVPCSLLQLYKWRHKNHPCNIAQLLLEAHLTVKVSNIPSSAIPSCPRGGWGPREERNKGASNPPPPPPNRTAGQNIAIRMEQDLFLPTFALLYTSGKGKPRVLLSDLLSTNMITSFLSCTSILGPISKRHHLLKCTPYWKHAKLKSLNLS
jgi:hypothetical protein